VNDITNKASLSQPASLGSYEKLKVFAVLPNLCIEKPIETKFVGLLPHTDHRVIEIAKRDPAVLALVNGFSDRRGEKCNVSVMVIHDEAPDSVKNINALVSFRNIFAISCVLHAWQHTVGSLNAYGTLYSDYFDFYPFGPTRDGKDLLHMGSALNSFDSPDGFRGQTYPDISITDSSLSPRPNEIIFKFLSKAWIERFEKGRKNWRSNKLFRSLAIAYHACSVPKKNSLLFYDFGVSVALWVSAFEILVHPGKNGKSDLPAVLALLSKAQFKDRVLKRRRKITYRKQTRSGNVVEYLYWQLYDARNDFLHGNPVTPNDALYKSPKHQGRVTLLNHLAPLLYQVALLSYSDWFTKRPKTKNLNESLVRFHVPRAISLVPLQNALKVILTGKERRSL
jgi:hypothetical protein